MRLYTLLEEKIGKDEVKNLMEFYLGNISFDVCPNTPDEILSLRNACHRRLVSLTSEI